MTPMIASSTAFSIAEMNVADQFGLFVYGQGLGGLRIFSANGEYHNPLKYVPGGGIRSLTSLLISDLAFIGDISASNLANKTSLTGKDNST